MVDARYNCEHVYVHRRPSRSDIRSTLVDQRNTRYIVHKPVAPTPNESIHLLDTESNWLFHAAHKALPRRQTTRHSRMHHVLVYYWYTRTNNNGYTNSNRGHTQAVDPNKHLILREQWQQNAKTKIVKCLNILTILLLRPFQQIQQTTGTTACPIS